MGCQGLPRQIVRRGGAGTILLERWEFMGQQGRDGVATRSGRCVDEHGGELREGNIGYF